MRSWTSVVALFLASCAFAQKAPPALYGKWTATVGGPTQVLRGMWSGQTSPDRPNAARGSWALLGASGQIVLEGTWSAQKTRLGWQGTWAAQTKSGRSFSGTWRADIADSSGKTFEEMLEWTAEKQIAGSWRSGRYQGNWWLKGSSQPDR